LPPFYIVLQVTLNESGNQPQSNILSKINTKYS